MQLIDALERVAELAKTLSCAEHRVLHQLLLRAYRENRHTAKGSTRELAHATGLARSNVKSALHSLVERNVIATDQGSSVRAAEYRLAFLDLIVLSVSVVPGSKLGPPPPPETVQVGLFQTQGGPNLDPGVGAQQAHPPLFANKERAPARVDIDFDSLKTIDRLLTAKPKKADPEAIQFFRGFLHSYVAKLGREPHPHAPDDLIVAQFLSCGEVHQLEKLLYDLMAERKEPGHSYAWFVSVALQRLHGISPQQFKQRRSELRVVKQRPAEEQISVTAIQQQIADLAQEKRLHVR